MNNHVIDPTFFYDAIEEFAFNYEVYVNTNYTIDEYGIRKNSYEKHVIRGSLQSKGTTQRQSKSGNTQSRGYNFYCKSLYRINIGDFIKYKNNWLHVDSVRDYDEYGVRSCTLTMIELSSYKDFAEYIKYIEGEEIV